ncbi:DUF6968 family protein [Halopseudomonas salegens]|uniref:DUF6968 domain-containing protein n=1 Tax=Halopseudomonas salegens TaxID=1434072 RepID=A0A1H2GQ16_9GAMM|nr:hypothetical protein [Halopseudomonas salegens]SDU21760.1 hypothetical protein SAMN05216210_2471 [Halopseudomonas salegens]
MALVSKLSDVIATREIELVLKDGAKETYLVSIARPELAETRDSYVCAHEFLSETFEKIINIHGVDPFQALELSIKSIAPYLEYLERKRGGIFHFSGEPGHCFPKSKQV